MLALTALLGAACETAVAPERDDGTLVGRPGPDPVARGEYLVTVLACDDCHTPYEMTPEGPRPDMTRRLSGHPETLEMPPPPDLPEGPWLWIGAASNTAFAGPWGVSYASNLTPDPNTGLGVWTEDLFLRALQTGRHMGTSRPIMPPMPWPAYGQLTDDDLRAVWAYLQTVRPIVNHVPDGKPVEPPVSP